MALESSPDKPQPLREIAKGVKAWIDKLGWVWVEAQVLQINRRAGTRTVFLTLRDPLAEVSASVTMSAKEDFVASIVTPAFRRCRARAPASRAISWAAAMSTDRDGCGETIPSRRLAAT